MRSDHFEGLLNRLGNRAAQSVLGILGIKNRPLRAHLEAIFSLPPGVRGSYLGDPVFEATFGWREADKSIQQLAGDLLSETLVMAMDKPPKELKEYAFKSEWHPYKHQLEAWQHLAGEEARSAIITSGTGSGKTECFLIPVLDDLTRQAEQAKQPLKGVQALFLYPLNALIASQRDRLRAWTHGLPGNRVKFCLYNGLTPHKRAKISEIRENPSEILDRPSLRETPPPILVTNATMLEYMLVRYEDAPILEQSQGKLKWVILDEAHTYIGSQAAELSLLLRRVMHGFGVTPQDMRFIATSATIGEGASDKLGEFLADVAGIEREQVKVIGGERHVPDLPGKANGAGISLEELADMEPQTRFETLTAHGQARALRKFMASKKAASLGQIQEKFGKETGKDALRWLDLCSGAINEAGESFLPLRTHIFHRTTPGFWVCPDKNCKARKGTRLDDPEWHYGMVYLEQRDKCECGAPLFDLVSCNECGTHMLLAVEDDSWRLVQRKWEQEDEFALLEEDGDEDDESGQDNANGEAGNDPHVLIFNRKISLADDDRKRELEELVFDPVTQETGEAGDKSITLKAVRLDQGESKCPCCGFEPSNGREAFRRQMLGAPFHLGTMIPTALEFCPESQKALDKPHFGQRLITFTDSRQGTARIAVRQQQDAERNMVRSFVYHELRKNSGASADELAELDEQIEKLKPFAQNDKSFAKMLEKAQKERAEKSGYQALSWIDMRERLAKASDVEKWMYRYYSDLDRSTFGAENVRELAGMLLAREFARRPKWQNSLETMGLVAVSYPGLSKCTKASEVWKDYKLTTKDWQDFLKICLDYHVRGNAYIGLPREWARWTGSRIYPKRLLAPDSKDRSTKRDKRWPQFGRGGLRSRLVRLLFYVLKLDPDKRRDRDICDDILRKAWHELISNRILQHNENRYYLPLEQISIQLMQKARVCPVTRRFLDVTFRGTTPYLLTKPTSENSKCNDSLDIPVFVCNPANDTRHKALAEAQRWLAENEEVKVLRQRGLWVDIHDRIIEGAHFFRVAEHSAQQPASRLKKYEHLFKEEKINILSCSTTMEMGVDIGGISTVVMNNVPPHPANYLQRAGRAGRRKEARATAITICKDNAHEQMVFNNSRWAFETPPPVPHVSLNSAPIVQRHVNSLLLGYFLNVEKSLEGMRLRCRDFFLPAEAEGEAQSRSPADEYLTMCERLMAEMPEKLQEGLSNLLKGTILSGRSPKTLLSDTYAMMSSLAGKWRLEHSLLCKQQEKVARAAGEKDPASSALSFQIKRMEGEYLLSELATKAFLPGYGFPVHVTALKTLTQEQKLREENNSRDDNRMRSRDFPARDAATAIREYAPGAEIVLDGKVYKSAGLSLTWQTPMGEKEVREAQDIRLAWRCRTCGETGTQHNRNVTDFSCRACKEDKIECIERKEFIQPSGYSVDYYEKPHNDVSTKTFIPVKRPWIALEENWNSLSDPTLGRWRSSREGHIFVHSSGLNGHGYSLCLGCGRADSQSIPKQKADIFSKTHYSLHFRRTGSECPGNENDWLIKTDLHLGFEYQTDVFELQLNDSHGIPLHDKIISTTLAVAMRRALAALLGVETAEIGYLVTERKINGQRSSSIILHDTNSGGSGYACQAPDMFPELFRKTSSVLDCHNNCRKYCHTCLLSQDTRFDIDHLDRKEALSFLKTTRITERTRLRTH